MAQLAELEDKVASDKVQLEADRAKMKQDQEQLIEERAELEAEKEAMSKLDAGSNDLISLNFRGEKTVTVKRSTLCQVEGSMMAAMFSGRYDDKLDFDKDGNVFLSYPPQVMVPLMDWLTVSLDLAPGTKHHDVDIPSEYMTMWQGTLKFFGLENVVNPESMMPESMKLQPMMFSGIKTNLKMSDLRGWEVAFCKPYSYKTSMKDFQLPGVAGDSPVLVGARKTGADTLLVAAIGRLDVIRAEKPLNSTKLHNGVFWYCTVGTSMGFAPDATVKMNFADTQDQASSSRMSWHLTGIGGWRAGSYNQLDVSQGFEKIIMKPLRSLMMGE